ncbi:MAG TPA: PfkB family carbohydrate kinase [Terriglobales bacterium]|nr:PfkB family carbohydrate kinase [Terriglobales bacterium]
MKTVTIGEVLWDVVGSREYLGGATFNFSANLRRLGHAVSFISAVGSDSRGRLVLGRMAEMGLSARFVRVLEEQATGVVTVTLKQGGQPSFILHRPAAYDFPQLDDSDLRELAAQKPDWVYFGTLALIGDGAHRVTMALLDHLPGARRFYDINLRVDSYTPSLVRELMSRATVVKLNDEEVREIDRMLGQQHHSLETFCRDYAALFHWEGVCITRGAKGCAALIQGEYVESDGYAIEVADAVGAGDAFAAAFLHGLDCGWPLPRITDFANRVGALVASRAGALPPWSVEEAMALRTKSAHVETT